tara:strand:- start:1844 stop:2059 length:216 start_codon:yes stop_codon:yes gene_type:complete
MNNKQSIEKLIGAYRGVFLSPSGEEVLEDIRKFSMIDEQAGSSLSLEEMVYRNALQDLYRYITAIINNEEK